MTITTATITTSIGRKSMNRLIVLFVIIVQLISMNYADPTTQSHEEVAKGFFEKAFDTSSNIFIGLVIFTIVLVIACICGVVLVVMCCTGAACFGAAHVANTMAQQQQQPKGGQIIQKSEPAAPQNKV
ncbi:uncharacterized protein LOC128953951 [Oppia nitens]|uniref:uncharacterized protein LOC128953951 n=1 Tax=Oppia nitens TaxID=1686743 RepID=UPI0023DBB29F|nr:uncharacterized protein LOC128953951 [Oppia nitens]